MDILLTSDEINNNSLCNDCGIYYDRYCTTETLSIPKKYKLSIEITIAHDIEDGKYRYGINVSNDNEGWGFLPDKTDESYDTYEIARNAALVRAPEHHDNIRKILVALGYLTDDSLPYEEIALF